jgi:hypothetical protein
MGYRSEVVLAVNKEIMPEFLAHLATNDEAKRLVFSDHCHLDQDYEGDGHLLVSWTDIKWYDGYPDVNVIEKFTCEMDEDMENCEMFRFVRVGEVYEDIEQRGYGFDIHVNRSIDY